METVSSQNESIGTDSVFPYPGSKARQSAFIIKRLPEHTTFIDSFGGSGSVTHSKPPSKNEVYNDLDKDLVQFFNTLRNKTNELIRWLQYVPYSRKVYERWAAKYYNGHRPDDPVERAGRFFTLRYMQQRARIDSQSGFNTRAKWPPVRTFDNARKRLVNVANRFSDVTIENLHYSELFDLYDDPAADCLFYCDPPYVDQEQYYDSKFNHNRFVAAIKKLESDWMISYGETVPDTLADIGHITTREKTYQMTDQDRQSTEHLITSFNPECTPKHVSNGKQTTLESISNED